MRCVDLLGWVTWGGDSTGADAGTEKDAWEAQVLMLLLPGLRPACIPVKKPRVLSSVSVSKPGREALHSQLHSNLSFYLLSFATALSLRIFNSLLCFCRPRDLDTYDPFCRRINRGSEKTAHSSRTLRICGKGRADLWACQSPARPHKMLAVVQLTLSWASAPQPLI